MRRVQPLLLVVDDDRLFCERLRQQLPDWTEQAGDAAHIAAICRTLDGVPLALELAAARVPLLGVAGVRARLDRRQLRRAR